MGVTTSEGNFHIFDNQIEKINWADNPDLEDTIGPSTDLSFCSKCHQFMDDLKKSDRQGRFQCLNECLSTPAPVPLDTADVKPIDDPDVNFICATIITNSCFKKPKSRKRKSAKHVKFDPSLPHDPRYDPPIMNMKSTTLKARLQALKNDGRLCRDYYQTSLVT
ncbi:MAG: hypothetical protein Hyperionvirus5_78 [Hyperionvirus sp.]|uniref:Uncharacterized protein n=1 Tax=Hyperionvirus sp. TaxID=2487770 RepID=A0A3G5A885_9VIRU|nr:MAG: hypothetical protein Hyperionvirus5_78 [Hyperionvirus sp.]